ncbi:unnamed protein product [Periconia digitata]|uniref:Kama family protein n=1 Tax=Periconia digitata TaxID=1303443 RepID=A0A9W4U381_9PLEO|nr:unnamed protein product [Periconia digitata]
MASLRSVQARISTRIMLVQRVPYFRAQSTMTTPLGRKVEPYWNHIPDYKDVPAKIFMDHQWQAFNSIHKAPRLVQFLEKVLPETLNTSASSSQIATKSEFIEDALEGLRIAPMNIRITPHLLSLIDWNNPVDDPIRRQFLPSKSGTIPDHSSLTLDSLHEEEDSPVPGLVHRYPGRALFLATSICPVYCRFCTRAYAVGGNTPTVEKKPQKPSRQRWEDVLSYIEREESIEDIVLSGGDCYYLAPENLHYLGSRLLEIPHIKRFRIASKGLAVSPGRIQEDDPWTSALISLSRKGREIGKQVCWHTHFNHPKEITWITELAAQLLFKHGVIVRNQSVLLRGVNDTPEIMTKLIRNLAAINIQPYYVYQCDLVRGIEDLRTPLSTILDLEEKIRGTVSGFMMPSFVVDLPGGGGKRIAHTKKSYDKDTGVSTWEAPGLDDKKRRKTYYYHDPHPSSIKAEDKTFQHSKPEESDRPLPRPENYSNIDKKQPKPFDPAIDAPPMEKSFPGISQPSVADHGINARMPYPAIQQDEAPMAAAGAS